MRTEKGHVCLLVFATVSLPSRFNFPPSVRYRKSIFILSNEKGKLSKYSRVYDISFEVLGHNKQAIMYYTNRPFFSSNEASVKVWHFVSKLCCFLIINCSLLMWSLSFEMAFFMFFFQIWGFIIIIIFLNIGLLTCVM